MIQRWYKTPLKKMEFLIKNDILDKHHLNTHSKNHILLARHTYTLLQTFNTQLKISAIYICMCKC